MFVTNNGTPFASGGFMRLAVFWALAWRLAVFLSVPVLTLYFYDVAESFISQLLHILPNAPAVDFEQLKQLWIAQSEHHVQIS